MKKESKGAALLLLSAALSGLTAFKAAEATHVSTAPPAGVQSGALTGVRVFPVQ